MSNTADNEGSVKLRDSQFMTTTNRPSWAPSAFTLSVFPVPAGPNGLPPKKKIDLLAELCIQKRRHGRIYESDIHPCGNAVPALALDNIDLSKGFEPAFLRFQDTQNHNGRKRSTG